MAEKNVQDSRQRIWHDAQQHQFGSYAELNSWMGERCRNLSSELRHPEFGHCSVAEMLGQGQAQMMSMPAPFDAYVEKLMQVSPPLANECDFIRRLIWSTCWSVKSAKVKRDGSP